MMLTFTRCASLSDDRNGALLLKIAETGARVLKITLEFPTKESWRAFQEIKPSLMAGGVYGTIEWKELREFMGKDV